MATSISRDRHDELSQGAVTLVRLKSGATSQRAFLRRLQSALAGESTLGSLFPGPSNEIFVIAQGVEDQLRRNLQLASDLDWEAQLRTWGALTINRLPRDGLFELMRRRQPSRTGNPPATDKVSIIETIPPSVADATSKMAVAFQGPFDWNLDARGANVAAAWEMFAADGHFSSSLPWDGISVGHIDTGYTEHIALGWANGLSSTVDIDTGTNYWGGVYGKYPRDEWLNGSPGHGTRISGAIAGFLVNAGSHPFYGVAPGATIVPYRVTDSVIIDHVKKNVALAIREAVDDGCHIINISLGALFGSAALANALDFAYERGVIMVCAAGQIWSEVIYPGRYNRCVTMAGVGPGLIPWADSARGQYVDLCGPADAIRRIKAEPLAPGQAARTLHPKADGNGTSYATATCSGIAALWLAWHGVDQLRSHFAASGLWQIPKAFKLLARQTATPGNWSAAQAGEYGSGVINAASLLAAALPADGSLRKPNLAAGIFDSEDEVSDCAALRKIPGLTKLLQA